jgi:hypothetical protein
VPTIAHLNISITEKADTLVISNNVVQKGNKCFEKIWIGKINYAYFMTMICLHQGNEQEK